MVEKYRQEARNAQQQQPEAGAEGQTASTSQSGSRERVPLYKKAIPSFPSSISEIQPDGTLPVQPQGHAVRVPEDGIAEVLDDRAIRRKHGHSPLSTFSRWAATRLQACTFTPNGCINSWMKLVRRSQRRPLACSVLRRRVAPFQMRVSHSCLF